jgi:CDP-paratose 2-epimerase
VSEKTLLITGSSGLIGSETVRTFDRLGWRTLGVDNNMRRAFFGEGGDTTWNLALLKSGTRGFQHHDVDVRDRTAVMRLFEDHRIDLVIHCAAQPSHDLAAQIPFDDFGVNAVGTLNLLEATRQHCPEAVFIFMSTNKVYGDAPNERPLVELPLRYDYARPEEREGIDESCRIDQSLHSLFGASKLAADVLAQEYGRYFGMRVGIFRGGCLTGPQHSGVALHGFLSYLVKCAVRGNAYTVFGYKGKQVRDNIHSDDVVRAFRAFYENPRCGEVYNLGGGRENSLSVLEAIERAQALVGTTMPWTYRDAARRGDHVCYISDLRKLRAHFPAWSISHALDDVLEEMVRAEYERTPRAERARAVG